MTKNSKELSKERVEHLLGILKTRFDQNLKRHPGLEWSAIQAKLDSNTANTWSLSEMERTGGEPDVIGLEKNTGIYIFCDCSVETPIGRRNICYDQNALDSRKENKPTGSAVGMADAMGIDPLTEEQYRDLQQLGTFDTKTSSWLSTPADIRALGGAIFGDRRYGHIFVYHNSASSYYSVRGFRGLLRV